MAEEKKPLWGKKGKYKPVEYGWSGKPYFKGRVDDLIQGIKSERRGFDITVNLRKKQAKGKEDIIERARAEGVEVNIMGKKKYKASGFSYKAVGSTNVRGGFALNERGQSAKAKALGLGIEVMGDTRNKKGIPVKTGAVVVPEEAKKTAKYYGIYASAGGRTIKKSKSVKRFQKNG